MVPAFNAYCSGKFSVNFWQGTYAIAGSRY